MGFNPPPNWPRPPAGWTPEPGWTPDPSWPPPPPGWQLLTKEPPPRRRSRGPLFAGLAVAMILLGVASCGAILLQSSIETSAEPTQVTSGAEVTIRGVVATMAAAQNIDDSARFNAQFCASDNIHTTDTELREHREQQGQVSIEILSLEMLSDNVAVAELKATADTGSRVDTVFFTTENGQWVFCAAAPG